MKVCNMRGQIPKRRISCFKGPILNQKGHYRPLFLMTLSFLTDYSNKMSLPMTRFQAFFCKNRTICELSHNHCMVKATVKCLVLNIITELKRTRLNQVLGRYIQSKKENIQFEGERNSIDESLLSGPITQLQVGINTGESPLLVQLY